MSGINETGNAKNVALFGDMVSACTVLGPGYNPSRPALTLQGMNALLTEGQTVLSNINEGTAQLKMLRKEREIAFLGLSPLVTRSMDALKSFGVNELVIEGAKSLAFKIKGFRISEKMTDEQLQSLSADTPVPTYISASQMSFDNRLNNFDAYIKYLALVPEDQPNETEIQILSLSEFFLHLKSVNDHVIDAANAVEAQRVLRNLVIYRPVDGMVDVSLAVKKYVRSVWGFGSEQYKIVSGISLKQQHMKFGDAPIVTPPEP